MELKINCFRPVVEGRVLARCRLLRTGATIVVGRVELKDDKRREVGVALATYMFLDGQK